MSKSFRLIVGLATVALLAYFAAEAEEYWSALRSLELWVLAAAYAVAWIDRVVMAWKWNLLLAVPERALPLLRALQIYCATQLWGLFLPATVGADALRIACTVGEGRRAPEVTASVVIERVFGVLGTLGTCAVAMFLADFHRRPEPIFALSLAAIVAGLLALIGLIAASMNRSVFALLHTRILTRLPSTRISGLLRRLHDAYLAFAGAPGVLSIFVLGTVVEVLLGALFMYVLLYGLGVEVAFVYVVAAFNSAGLLARIPISLAGLGVFEAGFVYVLALEGVAPEVALVTALLSRIVQIAVWLPWWGAYLASRPDAARAQLTQAS